MRNPILSFLPVLLGSFAVLQASLNRKLGSVIGFSSAALVNACVLLIMASTFFMICILKPGLVPKNLLPKLGELNFSNIPWWVIFPGIFGYSLVLGGASLVEKIGALRLFIGLITGQLITGIIWDYCMEGIPIQPHRITGVILSIAGALMVSLK